MLKNDIPVGEFIEAKKKHDNFRASN